MDFRSIPAFCVNLVHRTDRWSAVSAQFKLLDWPVTRWPGVVPKTLAYPRLSRGACGIIASMRALWQHCYTANLELVAVFEDDVIFPSDFATVFSAAYAELPDDWLVWHLHAATAGITPVGTYVARFDTTCWGAHGYLVNQRGLAKLIAITDTFDQNNTHTADDILTTCLLRAGVYPYGVIPEQTLCFQSGEFSSDIPETAALSFWRDHKNKYYR